MTSLAVECQPRLPDAAPDGFDVIALTTTPLCRALWRIGLDWDVEGTMNNARKFVSESWNSAVEYVFGDRRSVLAKLTLLWRKS